MTRTLNQKMADAHEQDVKDDIAGALTKGSGSQWHRPLDTKNDTRMPFPIGAECKATVSKSLTITRALWKKITEECFGHIPTWWGRFYRDESLRIVDLDLVALERRDFVRILHRNVLLVRPIYKVA